MRVLLRKSRVTEYQSCINIDFFYRHINLVFGYVGALSHMLSSMGEKNCKLLLARVNK